MGADAEDWRRLAAECADRPVDLARHCGWLGGDLGALSLPRYPATFAAMAEQRDRREFTAGSWRVWSLSFVRTVCVLAAGDGKAVLWGNDVCPDLWAENLRRSPSDH